jgi:hypothetical protein
MLGHLAAVVNAGGLPEGYQDQGYIDTPQLPVHPTAWM